MNKIMNKIIFVLILILFITFLQVNIIEATPNFTLIYVVQEGDTLSEIANDYDVTTDSILKVNNISKNSLIKAGQELIIPRENNKNNEKKFWDYKLYEPINKNNKNPLNLKAGSNYSVRVNPEKSLPDVNIPESQIIKYHVGMGDTLFDLARSFNTSTGIIMALNDMDDSIIRINDTIRLPINNLTPKEALAKVIKPHEVDLLARAIFGEARGEPFKGQVAVGAVIINRVLSSYFPNTFKRVIYQSSQFSAVDDGQINLRPNQTAYKAARQAIRGIDPTMGSLYYYNPRTATNKKWFASRRSTVTIGDHVFAK